MRGGADSTSALARVKALLWHSATAPSGSPRKWPYELDLNLVAAAIAVVDGGPVPSPPPRKSAPPRTDVDRIDYVER